MTLAILENELIKLPTVLVNIIWEYSRSYSFLDEYKRKAEKGLNINLLKNALAIPLFDYACIADGHCWPISDACNFRCYKRHQKEAILSHWILYKYKAYYYAKNFRLTEYGFEVD